MIWAYAFMGIGAALAWMAILLHSERRPQARHWPPRQGNWLTAAWAWALTVLIYYGLIQVTVLDYNPLGWPAPLRWWLGGGISTLGTIVQTWGCANLGFKGTSGWDVGLVTHGAYARSRHPQYLGQIATLIGIAIIGASVLAFVVALVGSAALVYAGRVEEGHLSDRPGFTAWRARVRAFA